MLDNAIATFKDVLALLEAAKLYGPEHPKFSETLKRASLSLQELLADRNDFVIGIIGDELAFENEVLLDLSKQIAPAIKFLKDRGVERIAFSQGVTGDELKKFILFLTSPKKEVKDNVQQYLEAQGVRNINVGKIKEAGSEDDQSGESAEMEQDFLKIYETSLDKVTSSLADVLNEQAIDHLALQLVVNNMMRNMAKYHQELLKLTTLKRYDAISYVHILNVAILSMYFASKIGFSKEDVINIGIAALFHDIGKMYISRKILSKPESLNNEEFEQVKSHAVLGAELLLKYTNVLGVLPAVVAFEHHLKFDLSGYPKLPFIRTPHTVSLLVSICDVYDALSQRRGYKLDYSPEMIYNVMLTEKGTSFEPWLLDKFFSIMGIWPIGSLVSLTDGRVAVVKDENEDDPSSPKVEVIYPEANPELINLSQTQDRLKIDRYLNPWKEGKQFLHLLSGRANPKPPTPDSGPGPLKRPLP
jgi:putative nucleotidyltransferase with HDIG domain